MADLQPFPADGHVATWATWDGEHRDELTLRWENEAWTATGTIGRERAEYVVRLSPLWQVRQLLLFRDLDEPDLWLGTDGHGRWGEMNGAHRPDLDGATDVWIHGTPFLHTVPIRRLPLHPGDAGEVTALTIDVETLAVVPVHVVYERTSERSWTARHAGTGADDALEFEVDEHGLPIDVLGRFRRIA